MVADCCLNLGLGTDEAESVDGGNESTVVAKFPCLKLLLPILSLPESLMTSLPNSLAISLSAASLDDEKDEEDDDPGKKVFVPD